MAYSQRFTLEAPEACETKGLYSATAYIAEVRSEPRALQLPLGRPSPDTTDLLTLTEEIILGRLPEKYHRKLIGYSILKMCDTRHLPRLERLGNYALPNFAAPAIGRVASLSYKTPDNDVCWATYYETADKKKQHRRAVDFPSTQKELDSAQFSSEGIYLVDALVSSPEPRDDLFAGIVIRPHVQLVLPKGMEK
jgi:hypothetical protein